MSIKVALEHRTTCEFVQPIEPWNVLGEEAAESATARYPDSSVERVQISARGIDLDRQLVTCQGVPVPLTPTTSSLDAFDTGNPRALDLRRAVG